MKKAILQATRVLKGERGVIPPQDDAAAKAAPAATMPSGPPSTDDFLQMLRAKEQQLAQSNREIATLRRVAAETEAALHVAKIAAARATMSEADTRAKVMAHQAEKTASVSEAKAANQDLPAVRLSLLRVRYNDRNDHWTFQLLTAPLALLCRPSSHVRCRLARPKRRR